ncbi:hypothetical protein [Halotia branconii]|uniref:Uncharacterized protein n=1 Tax=Halotia branconii CENA392 TaxID=1539056 RepID=A0AAJ6NS00_9CYAN|nr:hypothetical protein [Halotia branconii]WGV25323.1 hypothetical protein QI031_26850 [Halotia branconii CENA392]
MSRESIALFDEYTSGVWSITPVAWFGKPYRSTGLIPFHFKVDTFGQAGEAGEAALRLRGS